MSKQQGDDKFTRLAVVASSALPDKTPMNDHLRHMKSTTCIIDSLRRSDRAGSTASASNSTPRYDLPSTKVRMGNISYKPSSSRKLPKIEDSLNGEEQRAPRTLSGLALQNHLQHPYQQYERSSNSPEDTVRFREYQAEIWSDRFEELCAFRSLHGHCHVPHHYTENTILAQWVKRQRYQFKLKLEGKKNTLTEERIRVLHEVDFVWSSHDTVWEERFQDLLMYKHDIGHCLVPSSFRENPQLAVWTKRQRREYKKHQNGFSNSMTPSRIQKLENIGFVWDCRNMSEIEYGGDSRDDSGAAATTRLPNSIGDIQSSMVRIYSNTSFSPLVRGDGQMPTVEILNEKKRKSDTTHRTTTSMNGLSSSALSNRICGNNDKRLVDQFDLKNAAYLSKAKRNGRSHFYGDFSSKANNMVPIDSDHGTRNRLRPVNLVATHPTNRIVYNTARKFAPPLKEVATRLEGTGATLISQSLDETPLLARKDQNPPRIPRCDFYSYSRKYFSEALIGRSSI